MQDAVKWSGIHVELVADLESMNSPDTTAEWKDGIERWMANHDEPDPFAEREDREY